MPAVLKIKIDRVRDLPVMNPSENSTDAFVQVSLDKDQSQRTKTYRKSLNPIYEEEFIFEIADDSTLQNQPLELKALDQDLYSSELIGVAYVDLNPLIMRTAHTNDKDLVIQGWFPLFDTVKGIRGSLRVVIKLQFIGNDNPLRDSSAGVQFFSASSLSLRAFVIQEVLGLVVDLVVEDDPESSWQDYFRKGTKNANDNRLKVLYNLSAEVRREIGKKTLELGGNAVLGYASHFDMVGGATGLVVRAYGTACRLLKVGESSQFSFSNSFLVNNSNNTVSSANNISASSSLQSSFANINSYSPIDHVAAAAAAAAAKGIGLNVNTSSSMSSMSAAALLGTDWQIVLSSGGAMAAAILQCTETSIAAGKPSSSYSEQVYLLRAQSATSGVILPLIPFGPACEKVSLLEGPNMRGGGGEAIEAPTVFQSEVQLLSMKSFGLHVRIRLGGLVMARSVKFLGKLEATLSDQETREGWWEELRDEIKTHARTVCCTHVIGYIETCTIFGDVCVLSAVGTAAVVKYLGFPTTVISTGGGGIIHGGVATENKRASPLGPVGGLGLGLGLTTPGLAAMSLVGMNSRGVMKDQGRSGGDDDDDDDVDGYDGLVNDDDDELEEEEGYDDGYDDDEEEVRVDEFGTGVTTVTSTRRAVNNSNTHAHNVGGGLGGHRPLLLRRQTSNTSHSSLSQHNLRSPPITSNNNTHPHTSSNTAGGSSSSINPLGSKSSLGQGTHPHSTTMADSPYGLGIGNNNNMSDPYFNNHPSHRPRSHRIQRPCSYVHVPYNHNNAPFAFMRLGE